MLKPLRILTAVGLFASFSLLVAADGDSATESLFNGNDLSGWTPVGREGDPCWEVRDGAIVCVRKGHEWLRSKREYGDFNFRFEYKIEPGANSGIYVRVPADGNHHRKSTAEPEAGFEVQLLDDGAEKHAGIKDYQRCGSVYDIAPAAPAALPPGEWNTFEINCRGQHVRCVHNGVAVVDATSERFPLLTLRKTKGYLGLQNHGGGVSFRNLQIGPARG